MPSEQANPVSPFLGESVGPPPDREPADGQLLDRFVSAQDEAAFAALLRRHGPMVLGVCRRLLQDAHEAEDAVQATFLVLIRKARWIGQPQSLGPWLHGVAYRCAAQARHAAQRRAREREASAMPYSNPTVEQAWRDLREVLDEELGRLSQKYRAPLVLVYLEGNSTEETARLLGCPKGTVLSRLARGRDRLRDRLVRRGVALSVWTLVMVLVEKAAPAALPAAMVEGTIKAAVLTARGNAAAGAIPASVAALTKGVLRSMFLSKLKVVGVVVLAVTVLAAGSLLWARQALADKPAAAGKDEAPKDEEKIVGTWTIVSAEKGGQKLPEQLVEEGKWTFAADGKMTARMRSKAKEFVGTYKLDPAKKPKEITTIIDDKTQPCIYRLDGDTLTICTGDEITRAGDVRPTEFATKEGSKFWLIAFKRETK